jgi:signal peptidase II
VRVLYVSAIIVLVDQITKLLVKGITIPALGIAIEGMQYGASIPVLGDFFRLTYIENPGMAFGIRVGVRPLLASVSIVASVAILAYLYHSRSESLLFRIPLAMVLGGAVGNLIDRVFYGVIFGEAPFLHGKVVDFFDVDFFDIDIAGYELSRWPVFNIADACVTVGVLLLLFVYRERPGSDVAVQASGQEHQPGVEEPGRRRENTAQAGDGSP